PAPGCARTELVTFPTAASGLEPRTMRTATGIAGTRRVRGIKAFHFRGGARRPAQLFMIARRKRPIAAAAPMTAARITPIDSTMTLTRLTLELNGPAYQAHRTPTINQPTKRPTPIFRLFPLPQSAVKAPV